MIRTRWECLKCGNICETRPFFNIYHKETGKILRGSKAMIYPPEGYERRCIDCGCTPNHHTFTFKEPKKKND